MLKTMQDISESELYQPLDGDKYANLFTPLTEAIKEDIIDTVLLAAGIARFNDYIRSYNLYRLFGSPTMRHEIAEKYPFMAGELWYSIFMAKVFQPYRVDYAEIQKLDHELTLLKYWRSLYSKLHPLRHKYTAQYNDKVHEFNKLIEPQTMLIKRYKKLLKANKK